MDWASGLSWLAALATVTIAPRPDDMDGADMGTAFGLDASIESAGHDDPGDDHAPAPWERRIVRRSHL
jgi:hypothetical protein